MVYCAYDVDSVDDEEFLEAFIIHITHTRFLRAQIKSILHALDAAKHYALQVSVVQLLDSNAQLGAAVIANPLKLIPIFEKAAKVAQQHIMNGVGSQDSVAAADEDDADCDEEESDENDWFGAHTIQIQTIKEHVHVRFIKNVISSETLKKTVSTIRNSDVGGLMTLYATVVRSGAVRMLEKERWFQCLQCGHVFSVKADIEQRFAIPKPLSCPSGSECASTRFNILPGEVAKRLIQNGSTRLYSESMFSVSNEFGAAEGDNDIEELGAENRAGGSASGRGADGRTAKKPRSNGVTIEGGEPGRIDSAVGCDYQEIRVQDQVSQLTMGSIPRSITVVLLDDLVDVCKAGDDIVVTAVPVRRWQQSALKEGDRMDVEIVLLANSIIVCNERKSVVSVTDVQVAEFIEFWHVHKDAPIAARNRILNSICPEIFGMGTVKLAVALSLIGGVPLGGGGGAPSEHICSDGPLGHDPGKLRKGHVGTRVRGESHLLLVGDPGCGKSQFLRFAAKVSSRSVLTTGIGVTSAGLTVLAARDSTTGEWALEAGALVLADGGVCCIDEFGSIREHDRATIHEAMEQQTISVAKAGLVCSLNSRATVIGATNPKQKYDPTASLSVNTAIASPLLSRFDLVLILLDSRNAEWDANVAAFILSKDTVPIPDTAASSSNVSRLKVMKIVAEDLWPLEKLQAYLCYVKSRFNPLLSYEAQQLLSKYYQMQRQKMGHSVGDGDAARTTIRMLESLVRLSQAHARLSFRDHVDVDDAVVAILLMEQSTLSDETGGSRLVMDVHAPFSDFPDADFRQQKARVFDHLGVRLEVPSKSSSSSSSANPRRLVEFDKHALGPQSGLTIQDRIDRQSRITIASGDIRAAGPSHSAPLPSEDPLDDLDDFSL
eukprot:ANDGO_02030.mRNA.1 putative DNA helicase MCM9